MSNEAQLALVQNAVSIIGALVTFAGAVAGIISAMKSHHNGTAIKTTQDALADNTAKTEEVGKAVNGRMDALLKQIEEKNQAALVEAVKAAKLEALAEFKLQLSTATLESQGK